MRKLRLLLFSACNRDCAGCCNKSWDLKALPVITDFTGYDEILLTGGEPMLSPRRIREAVTRIRAQNSAVPVFLYTAMPNADLLDLLDECLDGVTLTLHEQSDVNLVLLHVLNFAPRSRSLRLNIFKGVTLPPDANLNGWIVKDEMEWIKDCPLPADETFGRVS